MLCFLVVAMKIQREDITKHNNIFICLKWMSQVTMKLILNYLFKQNMDVEKTVHCTYVSVSC